MRDSLRFFQSGLALPQVAKDEQRGQSVGEPASDLLEKPLLLRRPDPRIGALVQPEYVGLVDLGVDGHRDSRLDAETLLGSWEQLAFRARTELQRHAGTVH